MVRFLVPRACVWGALAVLVAGCTSDPDLVWNDEGSYRWAQLPEFDGSDAGFEEVSSRTSGIDFVNTLTDEHLVQNRHYMNGSGVALGDVDGDGWTDVYFARLDGPNVLYRNRGGWRFEDITESAGVAAPERFSTGAVFADIDGDGDLDLLVTAMGGPNAVYLNDGNGRFREATEESGLASHMGATSMALADVDGDGDLDLYVANYKARSVNDIFSPSEHTFERTVLRDGDSFRIAPEFEDHYELMMHAGGLLRVERAEPNHFYLNDGEGRFSPVSLTSNAFLDERGEAVSEMPEDWSLTVRFQDVNGDGAPDLYVCNDFHSPDFFWLGDGDGQFRAVSPLALRKTSFSTMSVDFSDIDRDGNLDFFLTDMLSREHARRQTQVGLTIPMTTDIGEIDNRPQAVQNTLFLNRGDGTYAEIARLAGVAASDWTWSGLFLDVDLDGYEDVLLSTGHLYDVIDKDAQMADMLAADRSRSVHESRRRILDYPPLPLQNVAFRNNGDVTFEFMPNGWGIGREADVSNALAFADLDNDGDLDVVVNRLNDTAGLFRNESSSPRIAVRVLGNAPNTQAIGSKIRVSGGRLPLQEKEVINGGQYLSGSDPVYSFAAGTRGETLTVEILWRSGQTSRIHEVPANRILEIAEPAGRLSTGPAPAARPDFVSADSLLAPDSSAGLDTSAVPLFRDASDRLRHVHTDSPFDDFGRQPLLRTRLGQAGPGAAAVDLNGDGLDDVIVGAGRSGRIMAHINDGRGGFTARPIHQGNLPDDVTGIAAIPRGGGGAVVFAGVANYEQGYADSSWIEVIDISSPAQAQPIARLPFGLHSVGPLALADVDGDGDLDLFAGGRLIPEQFPSPASSRIYINDNGRYRYDRGASAPFDEIGMVTGAAFGDLNGDGHQDIVLATNWGLIRYFENDGDGGFVERTDDVGLGDFRGWWNGVALGDFDSDGKLDVVATNFGWNGVHERLHEAEHPVRLYYSDFNTDGKLDVVEAVFEPIVDGYVPLDDLTALSEAMPYVSQRTQSFEQFAGSTLDRIIGPKLDRAPYLEANTLTNMIFLNSQDGGISENSSGNSPSFLPGDASRSGNASDNTDADGTRDVVGTPLRFEAISLPLKSQFTPAFAPVIADFDGDGHEDVFLSQNFFAFPMDVPRQDAGRGLLLLGNGRGDFNAVPGHESGIAVYGEQRSAIVSDFDADGRSDLIVTQNGAETRMYKNTSGRTGLRVRLEGPAGNPTGVGSLIRLVHEAGAPGPVRIVSAGSGYLSQNGSVQVLAGREGRRITHLQITWPDGRQGQVPVGIDDGVITASYDDLSR